MKRFQKVLFALTAVVLLGWMGASTASAQGVTFFVSASGARPVRSEGLTEATGVVAFSANSAGTIVTATRITLDYGTTILDCGGTVGGTAGLVAAIAKTCSGNTVRLDVTADTAVAVGGSLSLSGVRVNANAVGAGNNVNVAVTATVPPASQATNPITLVIFTVLTVATVQSSPSTTVTVTPGAGAAVLFCNPNPGAGTTLTVGVRERFSAAFLDAVDEAGLGAPGTGGAISPLNIRFAFTGIPLGVRLTAAVSVAPATSATITAAVSGTTTNPFTSSSTDQDNNFDITITATDPALTENLEVVFTVTVPSTSPSSFPSTEATSNLAVSLRGASDVPNAPVFTGSEFSGAGVKTLACASYLLFPWVAYTADGSLDTGIAISNTSADPPAIGSTNEKGDVTLYFWTADGSTAPAPLKIATALEGGKSATFVASQIGTAYTGYVIAVCGFRMGHGLAAFLSPKAGVFGASYLAISVTNPRLVALDPTASESRGQ